MIAVFEVGKCAKCVNDPDVEIEFFFKFPNDGSLWIVAKFDMAPRKVPFARCDTFTLSTLRNKNSTILFEYAIDDNFLHRLLLCNLDHGGTKHVRAEEIA